MDGRGSLAALRTCSRVADTLNTATLVGASDARCEGARVARGRGGGGMRRKEKQHTYDRHELGEDRTLLVLHLPMDSTQMDSWAVSLSACSRRRRPESGGNIDIDRGTDDSGQVGVGQLVASTWRMRCCSPCRSGLVDLTGHLTLDGFQGRFRKAGDDLMIGEAN